MRENQALAASVHCDFDRFCHDDMHVIARDSAKIIASQEKLTQNSSKTFVDFERKMSSTAPKLKSRVKNRHESISTKIIVTLEKVSVPTASAPTFSLCMKKKVLSTSSTKKQRIKILTEHEKNCCMQPPQNNRFG
jgi:hypothetical protein